jgi:polyisoprenoid-binding protein YceI
LTSPESGFLPIPTTQPNTTNTFPATVIKEGDTVKVNAEFDINRKNWGIEYAGKADDLIRDEVVIKFDLAAEPKG